MRKSALVPRLPLEALNSPSRRQKSVKFDLSKENEISPIKKKDSVESLRAVLEKFNIEKSSIKLSESRKKVSSWLSRIELIHEKAATMRMALTVEK